MSILKKLRLEIDSKLDLLSNRLKALLITIFISASIVMIIFNSAIKQQSKIVTKSVEDIDLKKVLSEEQIKQLVDLNNLNNAEAETNNAFNETEKSNRFSQTYKSIAPPEDYEPGIYNSKMEDVEYSEKKQEPSTNTKIKEEEISTFDKVNALLKKQKEEGNNNRSTVSFSLKDRKKIFIEIPIYLCEISGQMVVNINVDSYGRVVDANINSSSSSKNECLVEHAIEYAKRSKFSPDSSKPSQLGTITFHFIGKH